MQGILQFLSMDVSIIDDGQRFVHHVAMKFFGVEFVTTRWVGCIACLFTSYNTLLILADGPQAKVDREPDPKKQHEIDRHAIKSMICVECDLEQPVSASVTRVNCIAAQRLLAAPTPLGCNELSEVLQENGGVCLFGVQLF